MGCFTFLVQSVLVTSVLAQESLKLVGKFTNFQHNIEGSVFTNGSQELVIRNFGYDGQGPGEDNSVFFYIVNSSYPYSPEDVVRGYKNSQGFKIFLPYPSDGNFYQYEDDIPDLRSYFKQLMKEQEVDRQSGEVKQVLLKILNSVKAVDKKNCVNSIFNYLLLVLNCDLKFSFLSKMA